MWIVGYIMSTCRLGKRIRIDCAELKQSLFLQEGSMDMCSLSVMRTPPSRPSVIAAASATPPAWRMKVVLHLQLCNRMYNACFSPFLFGHASTCAGRERRGRVCVHSTQKGRLVEQLVSGYSCRYDKACWASIHLRRLVVLPGGEASEDAAQEDFQYKLKGFIDSTVDKRLIPCLLNATICIHTFFFFFLASYSSLPI